MKTLKLVALSALLIAACDPPEALPTPKEATPMPAPAPVPPPPPVMPAPLTDIPATSKSPEAVIAYRAAYDLWINGRADEARAAIKKTLALDPDFVSAAALQGDLTPGTDGGTLITAAIGKAKGLPDTEMLFLRVLEVGHADDAAKYAQLTKDLATALPAVWSVHDMYGWSQWWLGKFDNAKAAFQKAVDVNPTAAVALNDLGVVELYLGDAEPAIGHLQKSIDVRPTEPNPVDSLGEAYLLVGKLDEADKAFQRALVVQPKFLVAWTGIALTAFYRGDFKKGYDALTKYRDATDVPLANRGNAYRIAAWAQLAQNKPADAMKTLDAWDAEATKAKEVEAGISASLIRLDILTETPSYDAELKLSASLADRIAKSIAPDTRKAVWNARRLSDDATVYARTKKPADAEKANAALKAIADQSGDNIDTKVPAFIGAGEAALAKGDTTAAIASFGACPSFIDYCTWGLFKAEEKAGQKPQAAATKELMGKHRRRWGESFYVWSKAK